MITLGQLLEGLTVEYRGCDAELAVESVTTDSRAVRDGVAFLALTGATHDGHRFVEQARQAGAPVVLVQADRAASLSGPAVVLDDTARAQARIAANLHDWPGRALRLAGITGTNGKTTTAHLLAAILRAAARPHARLGTTGNWMVDEEVDAAFTTPFPLELQALLADARRRGATDVVMEVSSHALDQDRVAPLRYQAAALTSFSQDHLDYHADMEDYLRAKLRLVTHFLADDAAVVAAVDDNPAGDRFVQAAPPGAKRWRVSKGAVADAEILAEEWSIDADGIQARVRTPAGELALRSPLVGAFNLDNALVACGLALALGVDLDAIGRGLASSTGAPGRLERVVVEGQSGPAVFVDYAHTPDAVARAIEALRPTCSGRLIVLLGCGGDRDQSKRPVMGRVASEGADLFYATSDNPRTEDPDTIVDHMLAGVVGEAWVREVDRRTAIQRAILAADPSDTVLIAGKGHEDYQILGTRKIHFDDREQAAEALAARPIADPS